MGRGWVWGWDTASAGEGVGEGVGTRGWMPPRKLVAAVPRGSRGGRSVGEGVGEGGVGGHRCVHGNGAVLSTSSAARDAALGAVKSPKLRMEYHQEMEKRGGYEHGVGTRPRRERAWVRGSRSNLSRVRLLFL